MIYRLWKSKESRFNEVSNYTCRMFSQIMYILYNIEMSSRNTSARAFIYLSHDSTSCRKIMNRILSQVNIYVQVKIYVRNS